MWNACPQRGAKTTGVGPGSESRHTAHCAGGGRGRNFGTSLARRVRHRAGGVGARSSDAGQPVSSGARQPRGESQEAYTQVEFEHLHRVIALVGAALCGHNFRGRKSDSSRRLLRGGIRHNQNGICGGTFGRAVRRRQQSQATPQQANRASRQIGAKSGVTEHATSECGETWRFAGPSPCNFVCVLMQPCASDSDESAGDFTAVAAATSCTTAHISYGHSRARAPDGVKWHSGVKWSRLCGPVCDAPLELARTAPLPGCSPAPRPPRTSTKPTAPEPPFTHLWCLAFFGRAAEAASSLATCRVRMRQLRASLWPLYCPWLQVCLHELDHGNEGRSKSRRTRLLGFLSPPNLPSSVSALRSRRSLR